ncbi:cytochrome P450 306a1-like isoform X1 [Penaeus chinensis]|uniref:cytochrome P450 306a1-like isoform X1 n=1 Tax=Penaeus chinensis TaxID=139456 RepID=UPI001FB7E937|nr:cytochrome P450 306a1-like isoform X1 [Penaeus chinensis]
MMSSLSSWPDTGLAGTLVAATLLLALLRILQWVRLWWQMPPGPWGLPLVGYLPWIDPRAPHLTLTELVHKYGRVYSLKMGSVSVVVIADPELIRETFNQKITTGRAPLYLTHGIMKGYGLICAEGDLWRDHRKFVLGFMRHHGMKNTGSRGAMEPRIHEVGVQLTKELAEESEGVDISGKLMHHVGNTMNQLIFGLTYQEDDGTWRWLRHLLEEGTKLVGVAGPLNFLPCMRYLPQYNRVFSFITYNQRKTHAEYQKIISAHEEDLQQESSSSSHGSQAAVDETPSDDEAKDTPRHIVDAYVKKRRQLGENVGTFTYKQLHHVAADLFGAGSETTITTLKWHLLNMALFPDIQTRIQRELDEQAKGRDYVTLGEGEDLPLTQAAIMESQRLRSVVPLGIPHGVSQELRVAGYRVPRDTMILPLLWFVHHNPDTWPDPELYRPERFLDTEGRVLKHPAFMPFQTGRRRCIGDEFAMMILFIFTTRILLKFRIKLEDELKGDPSQEPVCGITLSPRPFKLVFEPRESK